LAKNTRFVAVMPAFIHPDDNKTTIFKRSHTRDKLCTGRKAVNLELIARFRAICGKYLCEYTPAVPVLIF
jgi:hypothetical protein